MRSDDVDLDAHTLKRAQRRVARKVDTPGYEAGKRVARLGPVLLVNLMSSKENRERWVLETSVGTPVGPHSLTRRKLHAVLVRLQLPRFSWHRLRKLHSTYVADRGVEQRVLQAQTPARGCGRASQCVRSGSTSVAPVRSWRASALMFRSEDQGRSARTQRRPGWLRELRSCSSMVQAR